MTIIYQYQNEIFAADETLPLSVLYSSMENDNSPYSAAAAFLDIDADQECRYSLGELLTDASTVVNGKCHLCCILPLLLLLLLLCKQQPISNKTSNRK